MDAAGSGEAQADVAAALERRRARVAEAWSLTREAVLVGAGEPVPLPGRGDMTYPFLAHSEYYYLTDRNRPGGVLAFDPQDGWVEFAPPIDAGERLWLGTAAEPSDALSSDALEGWLAARSGRPVAWLGIPAEGARGDPALSDDLRAALDRVRRSKDALELQRMRVAERATRAAFAAVVPLLRDGTAERAAQIEFETHALRHGADAMAYDTIVASGPNAAALHFAPTARPMRTGELVLIDGGGDYRGYASDITRTYPVGGRLTPEQRELHRVVHAAESAAIDMCAPGVEWRDVHLAATRVIAEGLASFGVLRGGVDALVESGAVWLFFPHGVGHLVGLGVRDAGGILPERRDDPPPFPHLRIDLPLASGMVVTVEPGVYFAPALLEDPDTRSRHRDRVVWERVDRLLEFGGIRIEDNVLITDAGHEVITSDVPVLGVGDPPEPG